MDERFERGMKMRREVLGDEHVDRAVAATSALDARFQAHVVHTVWADLWSDPTLDRKTRSCITIAILAALGAEELELHLRAASNTGVSDAELAQVLAHVATYAGIPRANSAFATARRIRGPK